MGHWRDLLTDPIGSTHEEDVINGLAAATQLNWAELEHDPVFLVIWGVDAEEALHADGPRRTANDEKLIVSKVRAVI